MSETKVTKMLDVGTQTLLLRDAYDAHCNCGRGLLWTTDEEHDDPSVTAVTECVCGMIYTAWLPTVKIEGVDRNAL